MKMSAANQLTADAVTRYIVRPYGGGVQLWDTIAAEHGREAWCFQTWTVFEHNAQRIADRWNSIFISNLETAS